MSSPGPVNETQIEKLREGLQVGPELAAEIAAEVLKKVRPYVAGIEEELWALEEVLETKSIEARRKLENRIYDISRRVRDLKVDIVWAVLEVLLNTRMCFVECAGYDCSHWFDIERDGSIIVKRCDEEG